MQTNFYILCAQTVPENYTWDVGIPLDGSAATTTLTDSNTTTTTYVSGYSPGVRVVFQNASIPASGYDNIAYNWNFGDYYNDTNNFVSLCCISMVDHVYIMPGTYRVTLSLKQTRTVSQGVNNDLLCRGKYGIRWFWDDLNSTDQNPITWDQTRDKARFQKQWINETQCFQKHCKSWSWQDLESINPVVWSVTQTGGELEKLWMYETNDTVCTITDASFLDTTDAVEQTITTTEIVVKEKPPIAGMYSMTRPITGYTPYTVRLTPRTTQCGSFPIDRIDWDFGDGSPIKTITRFASPSGSDIVVNDNILDPIPFPNDPSDVRNFDVLHTYVVNKNTYPVFYPSLTCYSACTNTSDSCCITIGPISLSAQPTKTHLLKARNTLKGNIFTFNVGNNIAFTTTTPITSQTVNTIYNTPTTKLRDAYGTVYNYFGNSGLTYPPEYTVTCNSDGFQTVLDTYIATEDLTIANNIMISSVPIESEDEITFIP